MKSHLSAIAIGIAVATAHPASAEEKAPHENGAAQLHLAVEKSEVEIELTLPGDDAVGFEHAAESAEDRRAVDAAMKTLRDGAALFLFPAAAGCKLEKTEVNLLTGSKEHEGEHEKEHGKDHVHEKAEKHEHEHEHESGHTAFRAHYHFHCDAPAQARSVDLRVFTAFPTLREVRALTLSAAGQGAMELTPRATSLKF